MFGDTPNVAARVQALAGPDALVATEATHRLVSGRFIVEAIGERPLKGVQTPVAVYRVVEASGARSRLAASGLQGLTPFVGREAERRVLAERWAHTRRGEGQVVLITGEAGMGKSRLVKTLEEDLAEEPHTWIECAGSPYHQNSPLYAVTEMLNHAVVGHGDEPAERRRERLEQSLAAAGLPLSEALSLVAPLLNLPLPERDPSLRLTAEAQRQKLLLTIVAWLLGLARLQPVIVVVEDLHWVDPSTLELQSLLVERVASARVMLLYTGRPEFRAPWPLLAHHAQVTLGRLSPRHVRDMIALVAPRVELDEPVIEVVADRTDGNPLFVEELTKALLEADASGTIPGRTIPATLQDSLMARLDRLGGAKEVAQVGAVIGREFSYALLHAVSPLPGAELRAALARLTDAELLYPRGLPPDATYVFKHALVQDAAYASLLKRRRRELHAAIARVLIERFPDTAETEPELVAVHQTESGDAERAVEAWQRAGDRAFRRGGLSEAVSHFRRGLAVLATLPESPARDEREFRLQLPLGQALMMTEAFASPEVAEALARARALSPKRGDPVQAVLLLCGLTASTIYRDGPRAAQSLADQALAAAQQTGRSSLLVLAHNLQGMNRLLAGDLMVARQHYVSALAAYGDAMQRPVQPNDARIPMQRIATLPLAALVAWHLGRATEAHAYAQEAVDLAERSGRPADRASAETNLTFFYVCLREPAAVREFAERAACAEREGMARPSGTLMIVRGWALAEEGQPAEGLAMVRAGLERFRATGQRINLAFHLNLLADVHVCAGNVSDALAVLADVDDAALGEEVWRADTFRRRAELLARAGFDAATAEAAFLDALTVARRQGAKAYELRAATGYARFLRARNRATEARALLAPVYTWFTEGFDTRDLVDAKSLLEDLG